MAIAVEKEYNLLIEAKNSDLLPDSKLLLDTVNLIQNEIGSSKT